LGHNFGSRHARRSSKGSIDAGDHLVFKKRLSQIFWLIGLASRARQSSSKKQKHPHFASLSQANPSPKSKTFFKHRTKKTCRIRRGFEQLSSYSGWRVITKKSRANLLARAVVKGRGPRFWRAKNFASKDNFQHFYKHLHLYSCFGSTHVFLLRR